VKSVARTRGATWREGKGKEGERKRREGDGYASSEAVRRD